MAGLLKNLFAGMSTNPLPSRTGFNSGTLIGRPTPIPTIPPYNPIDSKRPKDPRMFPGAIPPFGGLPFPKGGKSLIGS